MLLFLISTLTYILGSFVGFIVYVFLYLSYVGLLKRPGQDLAKRPEVTGFDSMKNGNTVLSRPEKDRLEEFSHPEMVGEEGFFFDHEATFTNPVPGNQSPDTLHRLDAPAVNQPQTVELKQPEDPQDEESEKEWPMPGNSLDEANDESEQDHRQDFAVVGDLSPDQLIQLTSIRAKIDPGTESYQQLIQEYAVVRDKVDRLMEQTGEGVDRVVSIYLSSRDKVLYNAFLHDKEDLMV
ncbi:hypothetical protein [Telluribacter sp.]|jgi:hypothetical protein|uniref:hypothetical protein n=1 Tax=Telluribacter sp. TaxID=1978767 RepID=UPI002E0FA03D|nr:hypothetical protein [Telluribacter sp.]